MTMLSPDLLDRRALAQLRVIDVYGKAVGPVSIQGEGIASVRKTDGTFAIVAADGFDAYTASLPAPTSPAVGSKHFPIDLRAASGEVCARRFDLLLPRESDPTKADKPASVFRSVDIEMLPAPRARRVGSACALRVTVRRKSDKKAVENALVRAQTEDERFAARGLTNAQGEATVLFPVLPIAFPGTGANLRPDIKARVVVTADPASVRFNDAVPIPRLTVSAPPFVDPDELGSAAVDFTTGTPVTIGAGRDVSLNIEWTQP